MSGQPTIAEIMIKLSDEELIEALKYVRDENGERMNLFQLKRRLREIVRDLRRKEA